MKNLNKMILTLLVLLTAANVSAKVIELNHKELQEIAAGHIGQKDSLPVEHKMQRTQVWCWGATTAMIAQYQTGQQVEDCEILSAHFSNLYRRPTNCCMNPRACFRPGQNQEMTMMLQGLFGISTNWLYRPLSFNEVVREIDGDRPIIAALRGRGSIGHVVVISGYYEDGTVVVNDPLNYSSVQMDYRLFRNMYNGQMRWTESLITL